MTFDETTQFLYKQLPVFQAVGASAYKPGLQNTEALDAFFDHPHRAFRTIHVAGTNGKGSISHTLAAILQQAGYRVGLYTSPHLVDFRERIRVDGQMIERDYVVDWVARHFDSVAHIRPSFFELTMMMAFCYFRERQVDVAVVEVGLGGRLDSTNVITPELGIISNISFDHVQFLGNTLEAIAAEKAGIIKPGIPVVIGEATGAVRQVFADKAQAVGAPIRFAQEGDALLSAKHDASGWHYATRRYGTLRGELGGDCQICNTRTILTALPLLEERGFAIPQQAVEAGFARVCELTGLQGRWQKLADAPLTYCDTGHNEGGIRYVVGQLERQQCRTLRIVIGMVNDKDITHIIALLPKHARYYFTQASVARALPAAELARIGAEAGLQGESFATVAEAYHRAVADSSADDFIFVGGSNFVIGDLLNAMN
jgi:dihydrofolate synthase/folylpolyglutamate synthase